MDLGCDTKMRRGGAMPRGSLAKQQDATAAHNTMSWGRVCRQVFAMCVMCPRQCGWERGRWVGSGCLGNLLVNLVQVCLWARVFRALGLGVPAISCLFSPPVFHVLGMRLGDAMLGNALAQR